MLHAPAHGGFTAGATTHHRSGQPAPARRWATSTATAGPTSRSRTSAANTVTILLGNRDGGFTREGTIPVGDEPYGGRRRRLQRRRPPRSGAAEPRLRQRQLLLRNATNSGFDAGDPGRGRRMPRSTSPPRTSTATASTTSRSRATPRARSRSSTAASRPETPIGRRRPLRRRRSPTSTATRCRTRGHVGLGAAARFAMLLNTDAPSSSRRRRRRRRPLRRRPLPAPVARPERQATPVSGTVRIKEPGSNRYVTLQAGDQIPVGSRVDTRDGRVRSRPPAAARRTSSTACSGSARPAARGR